MQVHMQAAGGVQITQNIVDHEVGSRVWNVLNRFLLLQLVDAM